MSHLILSHLSKNNNRPELVSNLFQQHARGTAIIVASRYEETEVFCIGDQQRMAGVPLQKRKVQRPQQLSLF